MSVIETSYAARSEPARIKDDLANAGELLIDDTDEIDYILCGRGRRAMFERKTATDLINSFLEANEATGESRAIAQLRRMAGETDENTICCWLIEGHIRCDRNGYTQVENQKRKVPFNAVDNLLLLAQRFGFYVVRSASIAHTAARMIAVAESWIQVGEKSPIIMLPKAPDPQLRTLMTFPGVGVKGAQRALKGTTLRDVLHDLVHKNSNGFSTSIGRKIQAFLDGPTYSTRD